ncbi:hypothetical protein HPP92_005032 [Vanilla planifolia]|uniref:Uncharacterized protein n=1 Tax=Vanilla planifolia TaxID=51239 RepID=A0A835RNX6_VANPL|nr:hypothetical protein HPP92_005032 [Vanilla planifolia]
MASSSIRSISRATLSSIKPQITGSKAAAAAMARYSPPSSTFRSGCCFSACRFSTLSRSPSEVRVLCSYQFPLQTAVAATLVTSRMKLASCSFPVLSQGIILCHAHHGS